MASELEIEKQKLMKQRWIVQSFLRKGIKDDRRRENHITYLFAMGEAVGSSSLGRFFWYEAQILIIHLIWCLWREKWTEDALKRNPLFSIYSIPLWFMLTLTIVSCLTNPTLSVSRSRTIEYATKIWTVHLIKITVVDDLYRESKPFSRLHSI